MISVKVRRVGGFLVAIAKTWGALVTGGFFIGLIGIWGLTGHPLKTWVGWVVGIVGLLVACFEVWNKQINITEALRTELQQGADRLANMRKALYAELANLYDIIEPLLTQPTTADAEDGVAMLIREVAISTYQWAKSQPDIFYQLPEAKSIDKMYSIIEFIKAHHVLPGLGRETLKLGYGFALALEASMTDRRYMFDLTLFEQTSPEIFKRIVARSKERNLPRSSHSS